MSGDVVEMCLVLVREREDASARVLLGEKLRGFGRGRIVAPGGKIEPGEAPVDAAARELREETGLRAELGDLRLVGEVAFRFPHGSTPPMRALVFTTSVVAGTAADSDEIAVRWVEPEAIPYDRMWDDARVWLPRALDGTLSQLEFCYGPDGVSVERVEAG